MGLFDGFDRFLGNVADAGSNLLSGGMSSLFEGGSSSGFGDALNAVTGGGGFGSLLGGGSSGGTDGGLLGGILGAASGDGEPGGLLGTLGGVLGGGGSTDGSWGDLLGNAVDAVAGGGNGQSGLLGALGGEGNGQSGLLGALGGGGSSEGGLLGALGGGASGEGGLLGVLGSVDGSSWAGSLIEGIDDSLGQLDALPGGVFSDGLPTGLGGLLGTMGMDDVGNLVDPFVTSLEPDRLLDLGQQVTGGSLGGVDLHQLGSTILGADVAATLGSIDDIVSQFGPDHVGGLVDALGSEGLAGFVGSLGPPSAQTFVEAALEAGRLDDVFGHLDGATAGAVLGAAGADTTRVLDGLSEQGAKDLLAKLLDPSGTGGGTAVPVAEPTGVASDDLHLGGPDPVGGDLADGVLMPDTGTAEGDPLVAAEPSDPLAAAPVLAEPEPVATEPEPVVAEPEPIVSEPEPSPVADQFEQAVSAAEQLGFAADDVFDGLG